MRLHLQFIERGDEWIGAEQELQQQLTWGACSGTPALLATCCLCGSWVCTSIGAFTVDTCRGSTASVHGVCSATGLGTTLVMRAHVYLYWPCLGLWLGLITWYQHVNGQGASCSRHTLHLLGERMHPSVACMGETQSFDPDTAHQCPAAVHDAQYRGGHGKLTATS